MGRLEELDHLALEHPEKDVRVEAGVEADAVNAARRMGALLPPFNPVVADLVGEEVADWSRF